MSLVWVAFVLITGRILATATLFADRCAAATLRPRRFIWAAGLIMTTTWPVIGFGVLQLVRSAAARGVAFSSPSGGLPMKLYLPRFVAPHWVDETFLILWACASVFLTARLILGAGVLRRWRRSLPMIDVDGVQVRLSPNAGPAVIGFWTAELMVPAWMLALDRSERTLVVRHEQEHVVANDARLLWLAALLPAIVPWNIFSWWQANRLRLAVEMDCDARVLRNDPRPVAYAKLLVTIAERWNQLPRVPATVPTLLRSARSLECRIAAITERQESPRRAVSIAHGLVALIALCVALAIETPVSPALRAALTSSADQQMLVRMPQRR